MEVLVSSIIFALVLIGLANLFVAGRRFLTHTRSRMAGSELGKYFLDPLQLQVRQDQWGQSGHCLSSDGAACGTPTSRVNNVDYEAEYLIGYGPGGLATTDVRKVVATITWEEITP